MQVAKGIDGIRKYRADDASNWHIWIDGVYYGFVPAKLSEVLAQWSDHYTLIGIQGNTLSVSTPQ